jgi:diacylglycerol kinase (ATP)
MRDFILGRIRSFGYAFRGIGTMLRGQRNAWIHALATVLVVGLGVALRVSAADWKWLVLAMVSVWGAEALNTALELLADAAQPEFHPLVKKAKDVAAGAVLIAAVGAAVTGALIFIPAAISLIPP